MLLTASISDDQPPALLQGDGDVERLHCAHRHCLAFHFKNLGREGSARDQGHGPPAPNLAEGETVSVMKAQREAGVSYAVVIHAFSHLDVRLFGVALRLWGGQNFMNNTEET